MQDGGKGGRGGREAGEVIIMRRPNYSLAAPHCHYRRPPERQGHKKELAIFGRRSGESGRDGVYFGLGKARDSKTEATRTAIIEESMSRRGLLSRFLVALTLSVFTQ